MIRTSIFQISRPRIVCKCASDELINPYEKMIKLNFTSSNLIVFVISKNKTIQNKSHNLYLIPQKILCKMTMTNYIDICTSLLFE